MFAPSRPHYEQRMAWTALIFQSPLSLSLVTIGGSLKLLFEHLRSHSTSIPLSASLYPYNGFSDPKIQIIVSSTIFSCHLAGLLLKTIYYKYFHIWKDLTVRFTPHGVKRGLDPTRPKIKRRVSRLTRKVVVRNRDKKRHFRKELSQDLKHSFVIEKEKEC